MHGATRAAYSDSASKQKNAQGFTERLCLRSSAFSPLSTIFCHPGAEVKAWRYVRRIFGQREHAEESTKFRGATVFEIKCFFTFIDNFLPPRRGGESMTLRAPHIWTARAAHNSYCSVVLRAFLHFLRGEILTCPRSFRTPTPL